MGSDLRLYNQSLFVARWISQLELREWVQRRTAELACGKRRLDVCCCYSKTNKSVARIRLVKIEKT
jgi:hypothetical protein